jgi:hypothetical protein
MMEWIKKFHESLHSMSIKNHIKAHYADSKRLEKIEREVKSLKIEHDILYAASLKRE